MNSGESHDFYTQRKFSIVQHLRIISIITCKTKLEDIEKVFGEEYNSVQHYIINPLFGNIFQAIGNIRLYGPGIDIKGKNGEMN